MQSKCPKLLSNRRKMPQNAQFCATDIPRILQLKSQRQTKIKSPGIFDQFVNSNTGIFVNGIRKCGPLTRRCAGSCSLHLTGCIAQLTILAADDFEHSFDYNDLVTVSDLACFVWEFGPFSDRLTVFHRNTNTQRVWDEAPRGWQTQRRETWCEAGKRRDSHK